MNAFHRYLGRLAARARRQRHRWIMGLFVLNALVLGTSAIVMLRAQSAPATTAATLPYHGYLELAGVPVDGKRYVTFTLYNGGGTPTTWSESQTVVVAGGHFTALLGAQTALDDVLKTGVPPLSIGLTIQDVGSDGLPTGTPIALAGRQQLGAAAYARRGAPGTAFIADSDITSVGGRVYDRSGAVTPVGAIVAFGGTTAPPGWLLCDGRAVSRDEYAALHSAIGEGWGAGGDATGPLFNLPDLRGRAAFGAGQGTGLTSRELGQYVGEEAHVLSVAEMPAHNHDPGGNFNRLVAVDCDGTTPGTDRTCGNEINTTVARPIATAGGGQAHNTVPPGAVVNYIIKF
jgi:microcystin-dependent protein